MRWAQIIFINQKSILTEKEIHQWPAIGIKY